MKLNKLMLATMVSICTFGTTALASNNYIDSDGLSYLTYEIIPGTATVNNCNSIVAKTKVYKPIEIPLTAKVGDKFTFEGKTYVKTSKPDGIELEGFGVIGWTYLKESPFKDCYWVYGLDDLRQVEYTEDADLIIDINAHDKELVTCSDHQVSLKELNKGKMYDLVYFDESGRAVNLINSAP